MNIRKIVRQCDKVGNFGKCTLLKGHDGVHKNKLEEFIQVDIKSGVKAYSSKSK